MPKRGRSKSMWILAKHFHPWDSRMQLRDWGYQTLSPHHTSRSLMITVYFYPIYSLQKTFRHPTQFFWVRTCNVDYTQECRSRTTSEQHPADSFSAGSQRPTPAGQQQCLEPAFLHGFARTCHTNHDTWAWGCKSPQTLTNTVNYLRYRKISV